MSKAAANQKLVVVVGETASGKSDLAMELARHLKGEIINADSWQIYRGMDIGTAKPSLKDRAKVPHHLLDIVDPDEDFTAAVYKGLATGVISEISQRRSLPIMVGGTGLYVDSVLFDYSFLPAGSETERARLQAHTIDELIDITKQRGYDLTSIDVRNKRRLIRLIESKGQLPQRKPLRTDTLVIGVSVGRTQLRKNIERRVEVMLRRGLKHEARELSDKYGWEVEAMKGIGYREWQPYFRGEIGAQEVRRKIVKSSLELAKRQRTWFKRNRSIHWVESESEALELAKEFASAV